MLLDLPSELTEHILSYLSLPDLLTITTVSVRLCEAVRHSHPLWSLHLTVRKLTLPQDEGSPCSLARFRTRYGQVRELARYLTTLSHRHIYAPVIEIDLEDEFVVSCYSDPENREIAIRYLRDIVTSSNEYTKLTARLYARQVLVALAQLDILSDLHSTSTRSLFSSSLLISRWIGACLFEPAIIHRSVDLECVPVEDTIEELVQQCRNRINANSRIEEILEIINKVLYEDFGLRTSQGVTFYNFGNNRTDRVLYNRKGIPITMALIYHEIGTKLGITLSLINFPRRFLLSFTNSDGTTMYLDCYSGGEIMSRSQCLELCPISDIADNDAYFQSVSGDVVLARLLRNTIAFIQMRPPPAFNHREFFILNLYKLMTYVFPSDLDSAIHAVSLSQDLGIRCNFLRRFKHILSEKWGQYEKMIDNVEASLKRNMTREKPTKPDIVKFDIGSVMLHKRYNYTCVLYGWDEICSMSPQWELQNGVSNLEYQGNQPFYRVLAEDGSERYVAQENLLETRSVFIPHRDIGKYFDLYDGERFVPNSALRSIYSYIREQGP